MSKTDQTMNKERRVRFACSSLEEEEARARRGQKYRKERRRQKEQREVEEYAQDVGQIYNAYKILKSEDKLEQILSYKKKSFRDCLALFLRSVGANQNDDIRAQLEWFQGDSRNFDEIYEIRSVPGLFYRFSSSLFFQTTSSTSKPDHNIPKQAAGFSMGLATREAEGHNCTFVLVNSKVRATCNCGKHRSQEMRAQDMMDAIYASTSASLVKQMSNSDLSFSPLLFGLSPNRKRAQSTFPVLEQPTSKRMKNWMA